MGSSGVLNMARQKPGRAAFPPALTPTTASHRFTWAYDGVAFSHLALVQEFPGFVIVEPHLNAALHIIYICPGRIASPCNTHTALFWQIESHGSLQFGMLMPFITV